MKKIFQPHFMIIPSLACNAECAYCFGPHKGSIMSAKDMKRTIDFISRVTDDTRQERISITFHGGEPLLAGHDLFKLALPLMRQCFSNRQLNLGIQSNLWLIDHTFCELFKEYNVEIGTSLDGPEGITDIQRGKEYFSRTMKGIQIAQSHGLKVNTIATFTPQNSRNWQEIVDFFISQELDFSIHPSVPSLKAKPSQYTMEPMEYGDLLYQILEYYIQRRHLIRISSLDQMCQSVGDGEGKVCTFRNCLGMFIAIDPSGDLYPCQRFCGHKEFSFGNITNDPSLEEIFSHPVAKEMELRQNRLKETCGDCGHFDYCKGGCLFNALAKSGLSYQRKQSGHRSKPLNRIEFCPQQTGRELKKEVLLEDKDPYCDAYRSIFDYVKKRLIKEMASEENIEAVAQHSPEGKGNPLLRKGPLIDLTKHGRHPSQIANTAKQIVGAVELAKGPDIHSAAGHLFKNGWIKNREKGEILLRQLENKLISKRIYLNNFYLYITRRCPLKCTHCYLYLPGENECDSERKNEMEVQEIKLLIREAKTVGFRQVVILGGEPLYHFQCDELLELMPEIRKWASPMNLVLRTNFTLSFTQEKLLKIAQAFDQVVVSVDGNEQTHDERRGKGTYQRVVENLRAYQDIAKKVRGAAELSLACVMSYADIQGESGYSVKKLGRQLNIKRIRFRPILPLGRAKQWKNPPVREALGGYANSMQVLEYGFNPVSTCGLGQNVYIEPSGDSFPCYAYRKPHTFLGNVIKQGLHKVIQSEKFKTLSTHTVDANPKCKTCDVRYLCGGACRAWGGETTQYDPDAPSVDCESLKKRARDLLTTARKYLDSFTVR